MYGLVHNALEHFVAQNYSPTIWQKIKKRAGLQDAEFVSTQPYDDAYIIKILASATEQLKIPLDQLLREFGLSWMKYVIQKGYGPLLASISTSFHDFLTGLDNIHAQLKVAFPKSNPPSFKCDKNRDNTFTLHYHSNRDGLTHFVVGLIEGVAEHFGKKVKISIQKEKAAGHDHDEFLVTIND